ncbi:protein of unknown function, DUF268 [Desulfomicrobium norvegicum]|uniref:Methyltransferase domain-containing protein n=1 Tax=Desulfomicrobium norvegicum (strain DSM 1741 / NCIMB 8310) TaxID=52561 RepID=A0A8G2C1A7_DESNO|nr:DUF268 domain-containing protein [Desulfomicrobium norvegicum]SFL46991.1 protein of unknown function, DUF268 [Desulfomicrobium norvegicum]
MLLKKLLKVFLPYGLVRMYQRRGEFPSMSDIDFQQNFAEKSSLLQDCGRFVCKWEDRLPCLGDATAQTGFDYHYIYHPAWAARILAKNKPDCHYDIGSSLAFVSLVSAFFPVRFFDYRPAPLTLWDLSCGHANLLCLPFEDASIGSLSCMHVVEHVGLERYGDTFDPQGDIKAMRELIRVLKPGGTLLFVVPLGEHAIIQYNAHRIYTYSQVLSFFSSLNLKSFAFVKDDGVFVQRASCEDTVGQRYGCGCFYFSK